MDKADLFYKDGSSDKVYSCQIEEKGKGYVVNFQYGRRGSTLTTGTKTAKPVTMEEAKKIFDKLIKEKSAKGYSPGEAGTKYQHTDNEQRDTGIYPQLLNEGEDDKISFYMKSDDWIAQEKFDGKRVLLKKTGDDVIGINRKGLTIGLPDAICKSAFAFKAESFVIDGECIGDQLYAFDLLELDGKNLRDLKLHARLLGLVNIMGAGRYNIVGVPTMFTPKDKEKLYKDLAKAKAEGIVFKHRESLYVPGRPNSGGNAIKYKFYATASFVVEKQSSSKHSVFMKLLDGKKWISVGKVTIPQLTELPRTGDIIEVRYLYAYKGGSVYQPIFEGIRDDIDEKDCKLSQLKYKQEAEEE